MLLQVAETLTNSIENRIAFRIRMVEIIDFFMALGIDQRICPRVPFIIDPQLTTESSGNSADPQVGLDVRHIKIDHLVALVMVAAAFTMRHARLSNTGLSVLTAVLLGFGLHYVRNFAQILGENGQLNPLAAAWAPPAASVLLALGLILHREDG